MNSKNKKVPESKVGGKVIIQQQPDGSNKVTFVENEYKFAFELRNAARVMVNLAKNTKESSNTRYHYNAYINSAIVLSYASLEASFNEIIHIHALSDKSHLNEPEKKAIYTIRKEELIPKSDSHVLNNFNMLLRIIGKPELYPGNRIYQNANLVRILRNMIVHPVPGRVVTYKDDNNYDYSSQQDIAKKLRSALKLKKTAIFPRDIITSKCAEWAVSSCESFLHAFVVKSGIDVGFITD